MKVDRYPAHKERQGFHCYEGVAHEEVASYSYCLLGDTMLMLPNQKSRRKVLEEVKCVRFPWGSEVLYTTSISNVGQWVSVEPTVGDRPVQVGV